MALMSVTKAVKLFDVSRPTLQKALKDGTVTGDKVIVAGSESWQIDPAELARVYRLRNPEGGKLPPQDQAIGRPLTPDKVGENEDLRGEANKKLQGELDAALAKVAELQVLADERARILSDMMQLLPKPEDQTRRRGLWSRLFKGR